jgi:NAD(P)-dependent dehydrogenase (short-subunit alcohol dehydrogenase family)
MRLDGKTAVITGASQGLGFAIARTFVKQGASVLICARTTADLDRAVNELRAQASPERVHGVTADVSSAADAGKLAAAANERWAKVDALVCNAGVYGPKGPIDKVDWESWADAISINLNGTVLCCRALLPLLRRSRRGKIVVISGGGATKALPFLSAYAASKAAVVRFGETLAEELRPDGIDVNMVAPGALNTRLTEEILHAGPDAVGAAFYEATVKQKRQGGTPPERGAELCAWLASDASDGISGKLISAVWDPWEEFDQHRGDLAETDIYTLRRIVPRDRGKDWG